MLKVVSFSEEKQTDKSLWFPWLAVKKYLLALHIYFSHLDSTHGRLIINSKFLDYAIDILPRKTVFILSVIRLITLIQKVISSNGEKKINFFTPHN